MQERFVEEISEANPPPRHLVGICRPNATPRGADAAVATKRLTRLIDGTVIGENQMGFSADQELVLDLDTLVAQGFDLPSVIVLRGSRGRAAAALGLDYHVDDRTQNCIDIGADSDAKTILIVAKSQTTSIASARKLGIGIAHSINEALDILDQATLAQTNPTLLQRIGKMVGWT